MSSAVATTWRFRDRKHPDPAGHVQRAVRSGGYPLHARVRVLAPADRVRERVTLASGKVLPVDHDSCILEAGAEDADAFVVHLAWFGFDFEVLEPVEVRDAVGASGTSAVGGGDEIGRPGWKHGPRHCC